MCADLVRLPMNNFDIIVGMNCLHRFNVCLDCHIRVVIFHFPNEVELVWEGYDSSRHNPLISNLNFNEMISKGLLCHLVSVNDLDHDIPFI